ncbi:MAG: hypothetical protein D6778_03980, partial [Nitrospirae bacterium]
MSELDELMKYFDRTGGDRVILSDIETTHLFSVGHRILSAHKVEGIELEARETLTGISARVTVKEGYRIKKPVHLCFGVLHKKATQKIKMEVRLKKNSSAHFIAHCIFPNAERVRHIMDAEVTLEEGSEMRYSETHYHGLYGGVEVLPKAIIRSGKNSRYLSDFTLISGRVGKLDLDYKVEAEENSVTELTAKVFGHADDQIKIRERVSLNGENARSLIKTRIALEDEARAEVIGETEGNAPGARGHVDCMEIVKDRAVANAVPIVNVSTPEAKVTHEAAIG